MIISFDEIWPRSISEKLNFGKHKWLIACLYKIQPIKDLDFENIMFDMLENIILDYDKYIIMGDIIFFWYVNYTSWK